MPLALDQDLNLSLISDLQDQKEEVLNEDWCMYWVSCAVVKMIRRER